jgi:hypothetical protein
MKNVENNEIWNSFELESLYLLVFELAFFQIFEDLVGCDQSFDDSCVESTQNVVF